MFGSVYYIDDYDNKSPLPVHNALPYLTNMHINSLESSSLYRLPCYVFQSSSCVWVSVFELCLYVRKTILPFQMYIGHLEEANGLIPI